MAWRDWPPASLLFPEHSAGFPARTGQREILEGQGLRDFWRRTRLGQSGSWPRAARSEGQPGMEAVLPAAWFAAPEEP